METNVMGQAVVMAGSNLGSERVAGTMNEVWQNLQ